MLHSLSSQKAFYGASWHFFCCAESEGLQASLAPRAVSSHPDLLLTRSQQGGPGKSTLIVSIASTQCCSAPAAPVPAPSLPAAALGTWRDTEQGPLALHLLSGLSWHQPREKELHRNPHYRDLVTKVFPLKLFRLEKEDISFLGHMLETWFFSFFFLSFYYPSRCNVILQWAYIWLTPGRGRKTSGFMAACAMPRVM